VFHIFVHIDVLRTETAIVEAVHHVVVEPFHVHLPIGGVWRDAIGEPFEYQMVAEELQVVGP
jgi:hypothetical protein